MLCAIGLFSMRFVFKVHPDAAANSMPSSWKCPPLTG